MQKACFIVALLFCFCTVWGQEDSSAHPSKKNPLQVKPAIDNGYRTEQKSDSLQNERNTDSIIPVPVPDSSQAGSLKKKQGLQTVSVIDTATYRKYAIDPFLPMQARPVFMIINYRKDISKDDLFYLMAAIILILAFIRVTFSRYFRNLFVLFLQTSLRQKQTRDQLLQDNLASLLTNLLFIVSTGLYITLLIRYKHWINASFWWLAAGCALVLLVTYFVKYLFLLFAGWVFNTKEATGSYIFVVFLVNKVLGIAMVPFLLILAFSNPVVIEVSITVLAAVVLLLLGYRYWVSFIAIRNKLKVSALHFFLYLCAVELLPLILIYKVLIKYLDGSF